MSATSVTYDRFWGYQLAQRRQKDQHISSATGSGRVKALFRVCAGKVERGENDYERVLIGFARSSILDINKSEEVEVHCRLDPVSHWNDGAREFELQDGKYNIWVSQYEGDSAEPVVVRIPAVKWGVKKA